MKYSYLLILPLLLNCLNDESVSEESSCSSGGMGGNQTNCEFYGCECLLCLPEEWPAGICGVNSWMPLDCTMPPNPDPGCHQSSDSFTCNGVLVQPWCCPALTN